MSDRVLTISQVAEERKVPLSKTRLYQIAQAGGDSPFRMRGGKWMVVESDLIAWVRKGGGTTKRPATSSQKTMAEILRLRGKN